MKQVYPVLRKRPLATVLLETAGQQNAYGPLVVIAEQSVGRGRVLFIGTDTLWRWQSHGPRTDDGVTLHSAFWQQAFRALAPTEQTSARRQLFLRPERTQYRVGDSVRIATDMSASEEMDDFRQALRDGYVDQYRAALGRFVSLPDISARPLMLGLIGAADVLAQDAAAGRLGRADAIAALSRIMLGALSA